MPDSEQTPPELTGLFLSITRARETGTLKVDAVDGPSKQVLFIDGKVTDVDTGREDTLLETALLETGGFSERDLKRARKAQTRAADKTFGAALLELDVVDEEATQESLREQIAAEVCELFEWTTTSVEFFAHEPNERLEHFESELGDYYEIDIDAEELFIEAARRTKNWPAVQDNFGILKDVFYATPTSMKFLHAQETHPYEHAIISTVDSTKDITEVIDECELDPFMAVSTVRQLMQSGALEFINPVQMYQLGLAHVENRQTEKAYRLFVRAHERGLDDFDLQLRIAQLLESLDRSDEAIERYLQFTAKCREQGRSEEAVRTLRRVLMISPNSNAAQEQILDLLIQLDRVDELRAEAIRCAAKLESLGDPEAALDLLTRIRDRYPGDLKLQQALIHSAGKAGDEERVAQERARIEEDFDLQKNADVLLETYQRMFCEGKNTLDVRLKLITLHRERGNRNKALEHVNALLNLSRKRQLRDEDTLLYLHQTARELCPTDVRSNRWLAENYLRQNQTQEAIEVLKTWIARLQESGTPQELAPAYEKLISIDNRLEHRWGFVTALESLDRIKDARRELRSMANLALKKKDFPQAAAAIERILKDRPLDLGARKLQIDFLEAQDEQSQLTRKLREIANLGCLLGDLDVAEEFHERLETISGPEPDILFKIGELTRDLGEREKAVELFVRAAKLHRKEQDRGRCRRGFGAVLAMEPRHEEATTLLQELDQESVSVATTATPQPATPNENALTQHLPQPGTGTDSSVRAGSRAGSRPAAEPFQAAPPIKTRVSNITARLRRLKSGGEGPPSGDRTRVIKASGNSAKLRALKQGGKADSAEPKKDASTSGGGGGVTKTAGGLGSAAARLKALAQNSAAPEGEATSQPDASGAQDPSDKNVAATSAGDSPSGGGQVTTQKQALGGAASKLAQLRNAEGSGSTSKKGKGRKKKGRAKTTAQSDVTASEDAQPDVTASEDAQPDVTASEDAQPEATEATANTENSPASEASPEGGAPSGGGQVTTQKQALGSAASKLAQLRKQGAAAR